MPLTYHSRSPEFPAAEYSTSAIGPVRAGVTARPRDFLISVRMRFDEAQKNASCPTVGRGRVTRPSRTYEPGDHMK
jgi:hypothetical protein